MDKSLYTEDPVVGIVFFWLEVFPEATSISDKAT